MRSYGPTRQPRRGWGALLLLLFVFAQGYAAHHHAIVEHRVCAVDGQLAHGDHDHGAEGHSGHTVESHGDEAAELVVESTDEDGHDEHCSLPDSRAPRKWVPSSPVLVAEPLPTGARAVVPPSLVDVPRIPRFRLAPKQSPPRVA